MDEKLKVLVFEVSPKYGEVLSNLLKTIPTVELIENKVNNTEEALELILNSRPDIIILGNDFPGEDSFIFTRIVRKEAAPAQVIMVAELISSEVVRQAMRAGACDFISYKNLTVEELTTALDRAGQQVLEEKAIRNDVDKRPEAVSVTPESAKSREPARVVTVYSPKGGAGVSTITANMARVMAAQGYKVLVLDGDFLFGDMAVLLNEVANYSIADLVRFKENLDNEIVRSTITTGDVDVLASPPSLDKALELTGPATEIIFNHLLMLGYDYILVNTAPTISDPTLIFIEKAETVVLVGTQEISSIRAVRLFLALMEQLSVDVSCFEFVVNRYDKTAILTLSKINESLDIRVAHTIPEDNVTVIHSNNIGIPFVVNHGDLDVAKSVTSLANFILTGKKKNLKSMALTLIKDIRTKVGPRRNKKVVAEG